MNASERRSIGRCIALIQTGDRSGALAILRPLRSTPARITADGVQLLLRFITDERFDCARLGAQLRVRECLERRGALWPSGRRKGKPKSLQCVGCPIGQGFAWSCPGIKLRPPSQPPEVLPASQRMAKRARALASLDYSEGHGLDPMVEASMLTPDDSVIGGR